nr:hypothetical protein [Tanacetum cinerariifolium]
MGEKVTNCTYELLGFLNNLHNLYLSHVALDLGSKRFYQSKKRKKFYFFLGNKKFDDSRVSAKSVQQESMLFGYMIKGLLFKFLDLFNTYDEVFTWKRSQDNKDKDQDLFTGLDQGMKRRKPSKEAELSKDSRSKENKSSSTHSQHKPSGKSAHAEEPSHTFDDLGVPQD